ncbi:MAG: hypothetical protein H6Q16_577 [Bacteroidetes bacterium]|nr:hypothetical protein [Bacteroidota bacterium]
MRVLFFAFLIFSFALQSFSQKDAKILTSDTILTKDLITNSDIKAKVYTFEDRVYNFYIDSTSNTTTISLRKLAKNQKEYKSEGNILVFDFNKDDILWDKKISYDNENFYQYDSLLIYSENSKIELWSIRNGNQLWNSDRNLYYTIPKKKIALTYPNTQNSEKLEALDLATGNSLWKREIENESGWEDIQSVNDSIYLIYANGFHTVNINDGKGIDFKATTDDKDYTGVIIVSAASIALGILTGSYDIPEAEPSVVDNIRSNVLIDSSAILFASRNKLSKIVNDKLTLWEVDLPKKEISHSNLFKKDSVLFMVNYGYAKKEGKKIAYGKPFLKAYNESNGNLIYSVILEGESVLEYKISKDRIIFLFDNGISKYSLIDGSFISNRKFDTERYGNITSFVDSNVYYNNNYIYQSLIKEGRNNYCVNFSTGYIQLLNSRFETIEEKPYDELYFLDSKYNEFEILTQDTLTMLINKDGVPVLNLSNFYYANISKGKLYGKNGNSLLEIDLNQIRKKDN